MGGWDQRRSTSYMEPRTHAPKPPCPGAHARLPRSDAFAASSWSFPKLLSWKNLTSEETEKKKSLQGAQHCWAHTREPQPQRHARTDAHCSTAANIQDKGATQMPIYRRMDKRCGAGIQRNSTQPEKEQNWAIFREMDGPRDCHTE